uniref:Uncharacterized protein n=1 Tax=Arundo donax TaxID=35708 RepID=A0A0A9H3B4_ARUDO
MAHPGDGRRHAHSGDARPGDGRRACREEARARGAARSFAAARMRAGTRSPV